MKVGIAQLEAAPFDIEANAARSAAAVERLAAAGADLVVLPELMATGYVVDGDRLDEAAESLDAPGPALSAWIETARRCGAAVVGGFAERSGGALFNSAAVITAGGDVAGVYRKLHLFDREREVFTPGNAGLPVFDVGGARVGILVCYDLRFPEALRILALRGAEVVAVPTAWVVGFDAARPEGESIPQIEGAVVQSNLNQVFTVCADRVGRDEGVEMLGRSVAISPYGKFVLGPLDPAEEGEAVADLDLSEVEAAQHRSATVSPREQRRTDVYGSDLGYRGPTSPDEMVREIEERRGYVLGMHRTLAEADPEFLQAYEGFLNAAYLRPRSLARASKEIAYIGALTALSTPREHLRAHMEAALQAGVSAGEILEVLEQLMPAVGVPRFMEALTVWRECALPEGKAGDG